MPDPPKVGLLTRYVLENPWPLTILLAAIAAGMLWVALREGRRRLLKGVGVFALAAVAVSAAGWFTVTPGEHGERVTRELVEAAVDGDVQRGMATFSPDAVISVASPRNPGFGIEFIERRLQSLTDRYQITSNRITSLRGYTDSSSAAVVHLACSTVIGSSAPTPSQWVLRIERQADGSWKITRLTAVSIAMQTPPDRLW